jgi:uncharacterized repeat protein (TIGR03943 family)
VKREPQNMVLLLLGVSVALIAATGAYTRYVKPTMVPWLFGSAGVLITLALIAIARDLRAGHATGHGGHADRGRIVWLLALPIVLLTLVVPPALNARAAAPTTVMATSRPFPPLPRDGAPTVSLPEVLMRIATGAGGGLDNRSITVTGFIMKDGEHVDLAKIVIVCCAADAQLARLHLAGAGAPTALALPDNTWVRVQGTVPPGQRYSGMSSIPTLEVTRVTRTDPPANTYGA